MSRKHELRMMAQVARMYYLEELKQTEIAKRTKISQASVSRLIKQAHSENIVRVTVEVPQGTYPDLEKKIRHTYGIQEAIVADCREDREQQILDAIGEAAAFFLETTLRQREVIGISSWSQTVARMVDNIHPMKRTSADRVVQMLGGMGKPNAQTHATQLTTRLAKLTNAEPVLLPAPGVAGSKEACTALLEDPFVGATHNQFKDISLAIVGIGALEPSAMLANSGNIFTPEELEDLRALGAVGDISLRFFDNRGQTVSTALDNRVIGVSLDELRYIPSVVAIAGGERKVAAIRGALQGDYLDVLITDQFTAQKLVA